MKFPAILVCSLLVLNYASADNVDKAIKSDELLNANYQILLGALNSKSKNQLKSAQQSWIAYRDKNCEFEANTLEKKSNWLDKSIIESGRLACIARMSHQRAAELKAYYKIVKDGGSKSLLEETGKISAYGKTAVHVIAVYEGEYENGVKHSVNYHPEGNVEVLVRDNPDIQSYILALSSYEPVNWHINVQEGAKLEKIILSGNQSSRVTGINNIPVIRKSLDYSYKILTPESSEKIQQATGYRVELFQGNYKGRYFEVF